MQYIQHLTQSYTAVASLHFEVLELSNPFVFTPTCALNGLSSQFDLQYLNIMTSHARTIIKTLKTQKKTKKLNSYLLPVLGDLFFFSYPDGVDMSV